MTTFVPDFTITQAGVPSLPNTAVTEQGTGPAQNVWPPEAATSGSGVAITLSGAVVGPSNANTIAEGVASVIYQPGGVAGNGVVTTWADVQSVLTWSQGKCVIYIDDSISTPAHVPAASGVTNGFGRAQLQPARANAATGATLVVDPGATLLDFEGVVGGLTLACNCQAAGTPSLAFSAGGEFTLSDGAVLESTPTATHQAIQMAAGQLLVLVVEPNESELQNFAAGVGLVLCPATATLLVNAVAAVIPTGTGTQAQLVSGAGTVIIVYDATTVNASQGVPVTGSLHTGTLVYEARDFGPPTSVTTTGGATTLAAITDVLEVTGVLASDATITIPTDNGRVSFVRNTTSGAHTVKVQTASTVGFIVGQGKSASGYVDTAGDFVRLTPDT